MLCENFDEYARIKCLRLRKFYKTLINCSNECKHSHGKRKTEEILGKDGALLALLGTFCLKYMLAGLLKLLPKLRMGVRKKVEVSLVCNLNFSEIKESTKDTRKRVLQNSPHSKPKTLQRLRISWQNQLIKQSS